MNIVQEGSKVAQARLVRGFVRGGFLDGFDVEFTPGGCVIIGEHGSGKSTLLGLPMEKHLEGGRAAFVTRKDFYDDR